MHVFRLPSDAEYWMFANELICRLTAYYHIIIISFLVSMRERCLSIQIALINIAEINVYSECSSAKAVCGAGPAAGGMAER